MGDSDELDDDLILRAIRFAVAAGGCAKWAGLEPLARRGLDKAATRYSADAKALLDLWTETGACRLLRSEGQ